jgi:hypothetical protein
VCFAITGLPPRPEELAAFLDDTATDRKRRAIRRLLDSPHYGERWARHWMDLVRYAESRGHESDFRIANAYHYRDYLIRAFNADVPYDKFVIEHIAGDLLSQPRLHPETGGNESILATGWPFFGEEVHSPVDIRQDECDRVDNKIDVLSKTFLGITLACARCHDHKFDAIRQRDYYAMAGFMLSSSYRQARFDSLEHNKRIARKLWDLRAEFRPRIAKAFAAAARAKIESLDETRAAQLPPTPVFDEPERVIADYTRLDSSPWLTDGPTFGLAPMTRGRVVLSSVKEGPAFRIARYGAARRDPVWNGLKTIESENDSGSLDGRSRAGKTIRTPTVTLKSGLVHYLIRGKTKVYAAVSQHIMITGPLHKALVRSFEVKGAAPRWVTHNLKRYAGLRVHFEFAAVGDKPLQILKVVEGKKPVVTPGKPLVATRQALLRALDDLADGETEPPNIPHAAWIAENVEITATAVAGEYLGQLKVLLRDARWKSRTAVAWFEGSGVDEQLLDRGSPGSPRAIAKRNLPEAFGGTPVDAKGSGRLALAKQIVAADNPLTSRVIVNRIWHQLFGRGLVATTDNFGWLGERPTHPRLLDYLAVEFVETHKASIKSFIERLVLTRTFAMSSTPAVAAFATQDPDNRLVHRMPVRRLEAEVIRDSALAISGRLDRTVGGKPVPVYLSEFVVGRGKPRRSGPLDGAGRRSIYTTVRRNFLPTLMLAFDFPIPFSTVGKRDVTNVPAQSLALMNDPFLFEQAQVWASRILKQMPDRSATERIQRMFTEAFARTPSESELDACLEAVTEFSKLYGDVNTAETWRDLCHSFFSMTDFIYLR